MIFDSNFTVRRVVTLVMTAQSISFRRELACKGHSTEKAQDLVTYSKMISAVL